MKKEAFSLSSSISLLSFALAAYLGREDILSSLTLIMPFFNAIAPSLLTGIVAFAALRIGIIIYQWTMSRTNKAKFSEIHPRLTEAVNVLKVSNDIDECWKQVSICKNMLSRLNIPCSEISWPIDRNEWRKFLHWQAVLSEVGHYKDAKKISKDMGFENIPYDYTVSENHKKANRYP